MSPLSELEKLKSMKLHLCVNTILIYTLQEAKMSHLRAVNCKPELEYVLKVSCKHVVQGFRVKLPRRTGSKITFFCRNLLVSSVPHLSKFQEWHSFRTTKKEIIFLIENRTSTVFSATCKRKKNSYTVLSFSLHNHLLQHILTRHCRNEGSSGITDDQELLVQFSKGKNLDRALRLCWEDRQLSQPSNHGINFFFQQWLYRHFKALSMPADVFFFFFFLYFLFKISLPNIT